MLGNNKLSAGIYLVAVATIVALVSANTANATKYSVCEPAKSLADVKDVKINDCENNNEPCPFIRGFNKSIELDFVPKEKVDQVKVKLAGKLNNLPVPFHVNPDSACGNYGFECPLEAGKAYKFKMTMPILRTYPKINVDVVMRLLDQQGNVITCVELPAQIREPQKEPAAATASV